MTNIVPAMSQHSPEDTVRRATAAFNGGRPDEARKLGHELKIGQFPFTANGRAMTLRGEDGFVRVVARADNHLVLGIQAVGQHVSELSSAFGLALEMGARLEDIVVATQAGPRALNHADHHLVVVEA